MSESTNLCVLVAMLPDDPEAATRVGSVEVVRALERGLKRIEEVIKAHAGILLWRQPETIVVGFERCDAGVLAACEMLERLRGLSPVGDDGHSQAVSIGLHFGEVDIDRGKGNGVNTALKLAALANPGQALASGTTVTSLTPAARHVVGALPVRNSTQNKLGQPVFAIGERVGALPSVPPASQLWHRLRLRHKDMTVHVDELRPILLLGRELGNDLVISEARVSRRHARIERRGDLFVLIDNSINGTYVTHDGGKERQLKHAETTLEGSGSISCGISASAPEAQQVLFDIV